MSDRTRLVAHLTDAKGGGLFIYECVQYPGLSITKRRETDKDRWTRLIRFQGTEYPTIAEAVAAVKAAIY